MPARKSAGLAGRLSTVALIAGLTLILVGGAFAAEVFLQPASQSTSMGSTQSSSSQTTSTSSASIASTSTPSQSSTTASSSSSTTVVSSTTSASSSSSLTTTSTASSTTSSTTASTSTRSQTSSSSTTTTHTSSSSTQPGTVQIVLPLDVGNNESLNFTPSKVTVVIGVNNTIVWNDMDYVQHTVQSVVVPGGAKTWKSGILNEGQSFTVVLTVPGTYRYNCSIHPDWMVGTIQVLA